ncbi:polysaccharide lyase 6 family protein [Paraglaciecola chathamensis]|uniref:Alginate lyase n=1 Tax=Paraglaciecola agarilytica NO2 TaxID=1125747 RepID=A0ABQ0I1H0_9ALTE|nr:polysaccharide lyase 6 family protein [Paraglaciecola agarilytica]GAC03161.1 alginate lyase [Paraglaciecola agarilytica NO2]
MRANFQLSSLARPVYLSLAFLAYGNAYAADLLVKTPEAYEQALKKAKPGDDIILANGTWRDFEVLFEAKGNENKPITLRGQTPGKVFLTGQSNLRLAGEHLIVSGLVFKDGYTSTGEVIAFRRNKDVLASHSRVTQVVIDNFSNPEKFEQDSWVMVYGRHNRFDHNHLVGKRNKGVTMAVRLTTESSQQNHHRIDHNYFGPRPILGSNGGETLRIGTSHHSLTDSFTLVENNYFDRCNGEVEIISNKSGKNSIRNNVFFESRGTLTLRHGNGNIVENNVFFGNGVDHTGGIRVINRDQIIRNNYLEGLTGYRFGSGLTVMNGVPNSKINRYHQVDNALIENNTLVNVEHIQFAAGSDKERSAAPINSIMNNNLIVNDQGTDGITAFDDISGIKFKDNLLNQDAKPSINKGFEQADITMQRHDNGLLYPEAKTQQKYGVSTQLKPIGKDEVGVSWYPKVEPDVAFGSGKHITVSPGDNTLFDAIASAETGDVLVLQAGEYWVSKILSLDKTLTIRAQEKGTAVIFPQRSTLIEINNKGNLTLDGVYVDATNAPDAAGNTLIRTTRLPMQRNYRLAIKNSTFENLDINHSYHFFDAGNRSFADYIEVQDSQFKHITGDLFRLNKETDDLGIYNVEYLTIENSNVSDLQGAIAKVYRGGTDESTFGPHVVMNNNIFNEVGKGKRNTSAASLILHGTQVNKMTTNEFNNSAPIIFELTVGEPKTWVTGNVFEGTPEPVVRDLFPLSGATTTISGNTVL